MLRALPAITAAVAVLSLAACDTSNDDQVVFKGNKGGARTATCGDGTSVTIDNDNVDLTVTGPCGELIINGDNTTVTAERVRAIAFNGDSNKVTYSSSEKPSITGSGKDNRAVKSDG